MINNEYAFESRVRISECDNTGKLRLSSIINYFQDCSTLQSELLGVGGDFCREHKRAWVLSSWQIVVERYPALAEEIKVRTWATAFKGLFGERNFCIEDKDGNMIAYANSLWVYMDIEKGRPTKPRPEEIEPYGVGEPLEMEQMSRKISLPEQAEVKESFRVWKYQIDTNNHMNNCQYVQMAMEFLEDGFVPKKIRVEYKKSALYGDVIIPKVAKDENRIVIELCDEMDKLYASVEFQI